MLMLYFRTQKGLYFVEENNVLHQPPSECVPETVKK